MLQEDTEKWLGVLKALELHLYVALADDELCNNIVRELCVCERKRVSESVCVRDGMHVYVALISAIAL